MLKLCYSIHNSVRICIQGVVAAYRVVLGCVVEQWLGVLLWSGGLVCCCGAVARCAVVERWLGVLLWSGG